MGDFIVTLPCLAALRRAFPEAVLCLLAHPDRAALAAADGLCDGSRSLESAGLAPFFTPDGQPDEDWRQWIGSFDLVISWLADGDGIFQKNVMQAGARRFCQGPWKFENHEPVAQQLAAALTPLGITLDAPFHTIRFVRRETQDLLAVHPGSGSVRKNWPVRHWQTLLTLWHRCYPSTRIIVITGEAETGEALALAETLKGSGIDCMHSHGEPLTSLCSLLAGYRYYLGHDTGISHLAAACGVTSRLIFGPASPPIWVPPAPQVKVYWTDVISSLTPEAFFAWLKETGATP
jgi:heptosyltransferase-2